MARITVEDCLKQVNNRFALVILGTKRAKQILTGSTPRLEEVRNKSVVTALREVAAGTVRFKTEEEMEADRLERERLRQESMAAAAAMAAASAPAPAAPGPALPLEPMSAGSNGSA